jgi:hypothetical protein
MTDLEMELVEAGKRMTVLLYLGGINLSPENMTEAMAATTVTIMSGLFHFKMKKNTLVASK